MLQNDAMVAFLIPVGCVALVGFIFMVAFLVEKACDVIDNMRGY